jgi:hypothetical protein
MSTLSITAQFVQHLTEQPNYDPRNFVGHCFLNQLALALAPYYVEEEPRGVAHPDDRPSA